MLRLLDLLLTLLHLGIIGFNLAGWILPRTRRAHLVLVAVTTASWLILGIWYGIGYCPLTDWQWRIKEQLGARNLPPSYVTWLAEALSGRRFPDALVNTCTAVSFGAAALLSVYFNFLHGRLRRRQPAEGVDTNSRAAG